ncbi:hypothetical protein CAAN1_33S00144 [[Candida] anglica]|uniref:PB1 domain-containing protein n=1 Tax=[Candida] anglica TaxID=148631 RepID=A0ABP0ECB6_9ASCO
MHDSTKYQKLDQDDVIALNVLDDTPAVSPISSPISFVFDTVNEPEIWYKIKFAPSEGLEKLKVALHDKLESSSRFRGDIGSLYNIDQEGRRISLLTDEDLVGAIECKPEGQNEVVLKVEVLDDNSGQTVFFISVAIIVLIALCMNIYFTTFYDRGV